MKQYFFYILIVLVFLLAGCTEAETEGKKNTTENPASQASTEKSTTEETIPEANDPVKKQHLSGSNSSNSEENPAPESHVSGSDSPAQSTHVSGQ